MITDSNITIFNRRVTAEGSETLFPTIIRGVTWYYAHKTGGTQYIDNADSYSVRVPINADQSGKTYVDGVTYSSMDDAEAENHWTIQKQDIVVRGELTGKVTDQTELTSATDDIFLVSTFANNTIRGSRRVKHWRIGGE